MLTVSFGNVGFGLLKNRSLQWSCLLKLSLMMCICSNLFYFQRILSG